MRERTTWDRNEIAKQAAGHAKKADPYTMNQPEHAKAQPSADDYVIGTPSDFAEDVSPGTWQAEYSGGQVKRNEIGMPEMRSDTFNHAEKTASEEVLVKKAALCVRVARAILPRTATEAAVEDQALAFMHLPDAELISTYSRLANEEEKKEAEGQQEQAKQAQDQDKKQAEGQQEQGKQAQAQGDKKQAEGQEQQAKQAQQDDKKQAEGQQQESKQAGEMPPQFKENAEKKKEEAEAKKEDGDKKEAASKLADQQLQAMQQMAQQLQQLQAQLQQLQAQGQQQVPMAQQQMAPTSDDQLLDQMLAEGQPQQQMAPMADDIELEAPSMDVGSESLDPVADAQLMQLFANQGEAQQAEQAKQASMGVRTASTRTVGARPSGGVSRLGGVVAPAPAANGGRDLSGLWNSAPDVSDVFGIPKG